MNNLLPIFSLTGFLFVLPSCTTPQKSPQQPSQSESYWELWPLSVSDDLRIVNSHDNEVLLRGVNITSLGEYWQGNPTYSPTIAITEEDFKDMANRGISVVRLIVHWSRLEPTRGEISEAYIDEIDETVQLAAQYGIYSVIDMHQDAYSAFIYTPDDELCPEGTTPGKGWDGAPAWATITDNQSTCITGERNSAPAVITAWNHFYDNTNGIQDHFVSAWGSLATRFAGRPEVAGYDLLNEPETSRPSTELLPLYENLLTKAINVIRDAEEDAEFTHLIFIEPTIPAGDRSMGIVVPDPERMGFQSNNIVNATHNYAESIEIGGLSLEQTNTLLVTLAQIQKTALWIGEYGFWSTDPDVIAVAERYAKDEDRHAIGGAWWQWRQPCGDPHSLHMVEGEWVPYDEVTHLHAFQCGDEVDLGATEAFLKILGRGYPRVAAGRIRSLESDPYSGDFHMEGETLSNNQELVIWSPTTAETHTINVEGIENIQTAAIDGGRFIMGTMSQPELYTLNISQQ